MSGSLPPPPPHQPRERSPQSPGQPQKSPPPQPRPMRTNSYSRYYRSSGNLPGTQTVFGWTPRTPAAPHTPVAGQRQHLGANSSSRGHPSSSGSMHSPVASAQPRQASPRMSPKASSGGKQTSVKPAVTPIPLSASVSGAQTPSWLKGTYRPQPPPPATQPDTIETWCKERLEAIKATVESKSDAVPELRKVMDDLDSTKVADEIALISSIRKEYWKARERQRKASGELRRAEREVQRIDMHSAHIDSKIARLRSYARFIEGGWVEDPVSDNKSKSSTVEKR